MIDISKHITMKEAIHSEYAEKHGINNEPIVRHIQAMQYLAQTVFEPLRAHFNVPIKVNSFYRCPALNKAIGGVDTSEHCLGQAMDISAIEGVANKELFDYINEHLPFNQLIWEFGDNDNPDWVHVSLTAGTNKYQVLRSKRTKDGKVIYTHIA